MPADSFESPLTLAACGGHVELAMLLLERGANIEEVNDEGRVCNPTPHPPKKQKKIFFENLNPEKQGGFFGVQDPFTALWGHLTWKDPSNFNSQLLRDLFKCNAPSVSFPVTLLTVHRVF